MAPDLPLFLKGEWNQFIKGQAGKFLINGTPNFLSEILLKGSRLDYLFENNITDAQKGSRICYLNNKSDPMLSVIMWLYQNPGNLHCKYYYI